ncbi:MAG TPA: vanadium-dependent haloperoxidase, partial [Gemmataceae bacterium]|nr:vanadium-dependent haloperoxidase [Gemmataceae bacterium]
MRLDTLEDRLAPAVDMVIQWNDVARDAVRIAGTSAVAASRIMAVTQAAVYDSVNALDRSHEVLMVDALAHPEASREAAVAAAAHRALVAFYPAQSGELDARLLASLVTIPDGKAEDDGVALGRSVADQILALRQNDGSGVVLPQYLGSTEPGQWRPTPRPDPANPGQELPGLAALLPQWGDITPFALSSNDQFRPAEPPGLDEAAYTAAFNEVKALGSANSATRTADQTAIARYWANGPGTATMPGHMNLLAQILAEQRGNTLEENARLLAALNVALADAVISCWDTKYEFSFWRPITGIREAEGDGNPNTAADAAWTPLLGTPNFPAYTSGHSTASGAAAAVLSSFFGTDDVAFTLPAQSPAFAARSYTSLSQMAAESAASRLYAGIHWSFDNDVALTVGA